MTQGVSQRHSGDRIDATMPMSTADRGLPDWRVIRDQHPEGPSLGQARGAISPRIHQAPSRTHLRPPLAVLPVRCRAGETLGECPFLTGSMAAAFNRGAMGFRTAHRHDQAQVREAGGTVGQQAMNGSHRRRPVPRDLARSQQAVAARLGCVMH